MVESFVFDTSGAVVFGPNAHDPTFPDALTWSDIGALPYGQLAQGYIEAAFASLLEAKRGGRKCGWCGRTVASTRALKTCSQHGQCTRAVRHYRSHLYLPKFSDLAPATLAAMLKDCEDGARWLSDKPDDLTKGAGELFWKVRAAEFDGGFAHPVQIAGLRSRFPPLTLYLAEDGLIYQGEPS